MTDKNPTTRRYPRSLQEAFPREHAEWIFHEPRSVRGERLCAWLLSLILGVLLAVALVQWWSQC